MVDVMVDTMVDKVVDKVKWQIVQKELLNKTPKTYIDAIVDIMVDSGHHCRCHGGQWTPWWGGHSGDALVDATVDIGHHTGYS